MSLSGHDDSVDSVDGIKIGEIPIIYVCSIKKFFYCRLNNGRKFLGTIKLDSVLRNIANLSNLRIKKTNFQFLSVFFFTF